MILRMALKRNLMEIIKLIAELNLHLVLYSSKKENYEK